MAVGSEATELGIMILAGQERRATGRMCAHLLFDLYWSLTQVRDRKKRCGLIVGIIDESLRETQDERSVGALLTRVWAKVHTEPRLEPAWRASRTGKSNKAASPEAILAMKALSAMYSATFSVHATDEALADTQVLAAAEMGKAVGQLLGHFDGLAGRQLTGRKASPEREVFRRHFSAWKRGEAKHGKANKKGDFMLAMESQLQASDAQLAEWYKQAKRDFDAGKSGEI